MVYCLYQIYMTQGRCVIDSFIFYSKEKLCLIRIQFWMCSYDGGGCSLVKGTLAAGGSTTRYTVLGC